MQLTREREAAGRVIKTGWPHYFLEKILVLMETPNEIFKRSGVSLLYEQWFDDSMFYMLLVHLILLFYTVNKHGKASSIM